MEMYLILYQLYLFFSEKQAIAFQLISYFAFTFVIFQNEKKDYLLVTLVFCRKQLTCSKSQTSFFWYHLNQKKPKQKQKFISRNYLPIYRSSSLQSLKNLDIKYCCSKAEMLYCERMNNLKFRGKLKESTLRGDSSLSML